jgi:hypothetical protein
LAQQEQMNCAICTHELAGTHGCVRYCSELCRRTATRKRQSEDRKARRKSDPLFRARERKRERERKQKRNAGYLARKLARKKIRRRERYAADPAYREKLRAKVRKCNRDRYAQKLGFANREELWRHRREMRTQKRIEKAERLRALRLQAKAQREAQRAARKLTEPERNRERARRYMESPINRAHQQELRRLARSVSFGVARAFRELGWVDERCEFKTGLWHWAWITPPRSKNEKNHQLESKRRALVRAARQLDLMAPEVANA